MGADKSSLAKLVWYGRRLQTMDKREMIWRSGKFVLPSRSTSIDAGAAMSCRTLLDWEQALERFRSDESHPALLRRTGAEGILSRSPALAAQVIQAADSAMTRTFQFFGYPPVSLNEPIDWHHDPLSDTHWPTSSSGRINHRLSSGDVKWIWELNRLQHLPWLAQAWLLTGDDRYSSVAFEHLDGWIEQNKPGQGIAWRGAFEVGIRAISIAIALQGLRRSTDLTVARYQKIIDVLVHSASTCETECSRFSSANNHLIGEMAGLAVISILIPQLSGYRNWEQKAVASLVEEADRQILPDGAGAEQAIAYQVFTAELLHLVAALLNARDGVVPQAIADALGRSSAFLAAVVGRNGSSTRYGDNDDGFALRLGPAPSRSISEHLGILAPFEWGTSGAYAATDSIDAEWFKAMAGLAERQVCLSESAGQGWQTDRTLFARSGGLVILRAGERRLTMDVGPLGYLSIAAHGHADALALTLSDGEQDLIVDPGTGSYYGHPEWRAVMRTSRAHSTVCVDDQDQSVAGGPFMWSRHAKTQIRGVDLQSGVIDAEHDGYRRLPGSVVHRRWLVAPPSQRAQLVVDLIAGQGIHMVRNTWPLHPSLDVCHIDEGWVVHRDGSPLLQLLHAATAPIARDDVRGDERRNLGWWSDRLESRIPAWWLGTVCRQRLPLTVVTLISPMDGVVTTDLGVEAHDGFVDVRWQEGREKHNARIDVAGSAAVTLRPVGKRSQ